MARGRPRKPIEQKKTAVVGTGVTEADRELYTEIARRRGMSISGLIRELLRKEAKKETEAQNAQEIIN